MSRYYYCLLVAVALLISCEPSNEQTTTQSIDEIKSDIVSLLDKWHVAAAEGDFEAYFGTMDSRSIFIGTDATENWSKQAFADFSKPYFDKGRAWDFKPFNRNIYASESGTVVWFDELLKTWMGTCIGSGVFEKTEGQWRMKHYVLSIKIPNESVQEVIKAKGVQDSLFLNQYEKQ